MEESGQPIGHADPRTARLLSDLNIGVHGTRITRNILFVHIICRNIETE